MSQGYWRFEVREKSPRLSHADAPNGTTVSLEQAKVYYISGSLSESDLQLVGKRLLCDTVVETCSIQTCAWSQHPPTATDQTIGAVEVIPKAGVMDPVAASATTALAQLNIVVDDIKSGRKYLISPALPEDEAKAFAEQQLANTLIEQVFYSSGQQAPAIANPFTQAAAAEFELQQVPLTQLDDSGLEQLSRTGHLFLSLQEMQAIQAHYKAAGREPTDLELETLAQTWSEHCVHKTLKSAIDYHGPSFPQEISLDRQPKGHDTEVSYDNLLADTIAKATKVLDRPWCLSVFEDNAGIIRFDEQHGVAFKVETHNHPSALEPYGGAATGIGGCIRDILGCGLGAKPIANTDVFCFADPELDHDRIPSGIFHPKRSMQEVVRGVRDYGNRMGIPTVNGAIAFDNRYLGNPLVFCGCVGLIPDTRIHKAARPGDHVVVVGGRTGRDGIHGATFSSAGMTEGHVDEFAHAVQIGNAITEKKVMDVILQARDHQDGCLYAAITDCGAGGLSSAVGEMGADIGVVVELEKVPLKYHGLRYDEIWISEAQERMVLAVPPDRVDALVALCASEDVEATDIGTFVDDVTLTVRYHGQVVGTLDMQFLHHGIPKPSRKATWTAAQQHQATVEHHDIYDALLSTLRDPNNASKEWVIRQYDHEVQGGSVIKPLMGKGQGPSDGAVVRPLLGSNKGIALSCGLCPQLSDTDPYVMAVAAIDEAVRNNICVGGSLDQMAILDNFCWADVTKEQELGALVRAAQACHDAALAYGTPFISGKDSLNNVFEIQPQQAQEMNWPQVIAIPGTLLISALSVVQNVNNCRSSDLKHPDNRLLMIRPAGKTLKDLASVAHFVSSHVTDDAVRACHDVGDGGVLAAAADMVMGSEFGVSIKLDWTDAALLENRLGCYLLELSTPDDRAWKIPPGIELTQIGTTVDRPVLELNSCAYWQADTLREAWKSTFDWH